MLAAIDFDDQPSFVTDKVGDIRTKRHWSPEAASVDLPHPQHPPESLFRFGHLPAQRPRSIAGAVAGALLHVG